MPPIHIGRVYNAIELQAYRAAAENAGLELQVLKPGEESTFGGTVPEGSRELVLTGGEPQQNVKFWETYDRLYPHEREKTKNRIEPKELRESDLRQMRNLESGNSIQPTNEESLSPSYLIRRS
jgi:hypothetical protein